MQDGLRLQLLGQPEIVLNGARLSFARRKAVALLAYVAMSGRPASRLILANLLAGGMTDQLARQHVRNALTDLSSQLGDYLIISRQTIAFNRALPYQLDVEDFERLHAAAIAGSSERALAQAAALYSGDLLAGLALRDAPAFDEWLQAERQRLRGLAIHALELLFDRAADDGDAASGLALAQRLLAIEPLRDTTHRRAMQLLARDGQREQALELYNQYRLALAAQLGVDPPPETTAFFERLRAQPIAAPHHLPDAQERYHDTSRELAALVARLADPDCRLVVLLGPDGLEKAHVVLKVVAHYRSAVATLDSHPFPDGIYLITVPEERRRGAAEPASAGGNLAAIIGNAVGSDLSRAHDPAAALLDILRQRAMLLVLDGLAPAESEVELAAEILRHAPGVKLIAVAREPFNLLEEWLLDIGRPGLS